MADNVALASPAGTVAADEVVDGTLGTVKVQYVKLMDGTLDSATKITGNSNGLATADAQVLAAINANSSAALPAGTNNIGHIGGTEYETVAVSQTDQIMGATGATGDFLAGVLIIPGTTAAGAVSIKDGNGSAISVFAGGGTTALTTLIPFFVPLGIKCVNATTPGWKITTGTNVTAIGVGDFT